jgi:hypothetical protein
MAYCLVHVNIRRLDRLLIGEQADGLRVWRRSGSLHDLRSWYEGILIVSANAVVGIGFAARFAGVTSETVRARIRSGGLTVFEFVLIGTASRYRFVPFSEVEQWQRLRTLAEARKKLRENS